jgi:hypothetical protein
MARARIVYRTNEVTVAAEMPLPLTSPRTTHQSSVPTWKMS